MLGLLSTSIAYLLGSIPFGYLIVRWQKGIDVRATGSGSIGATNVMRSLGVAGFVGTFILDVGKGIVAVLLAARLTAHDPLWIALAATVAILGHCFPVWLSFRGGKGVATGVGVFIALAPIQVGLAVGVFAVVVAIWRYVSLGSIAAAAAFPILLYVGKEPPPPLPIVLGAATGAAIIIAKHHSNIRRLLSGSENRLGKKKPEDRSQESVRQPTDRSQ
jgi:glycerol-3-phosphate acyltransferase PlsY